MDWLTAPLKNYATFSGRSRRLEFWPFLSLVTLLQAAASYFDAHHGGTDSVAMGMGMVELCVTLLFLVPTIAVGVRRLHDSGRSGLWMLLGYGPLALANLPRAANDQMDLVLSGALLMGIGGLLVMMLMAGTNGQNQYGVDPRKRGR